MKETHSFGAKLLVAWYAAYQAGHLILNSLYLAGAASFPPPPPGGWTQQTLRVFNGIAAADLVNAGLSLLFVVGFFRDARWSLWLGTVTLTVSMYAAAVFTYATATSGAWTGNLAGYLWFYIPFIPVVVLFVLVGVWFVQPRFLSDAQ